MSDDTKTPDRCPTCDRGECTAEAPHAAEALEAAARILDADGRASLADREIMLRHSRARNTAAADCEAHRVDWRARAIAAEIRAEEAEAHGAGSDALIDAICQRVGARDTGCGGQTVEAGEMRRRMNMTQRIDMLTSAAAQWAKVAPLIERLRHTRRHTKPEFVVAAIDALLAATEATP